MGKIRIVHFLVVAIASIAAVSAAESEVQPMVVHKFFKEAKKNDNWKTAFATGKQEQIVFMNVSPVTNPDNEIGMEVHQFDQVILIVEGKGKAIVKGETSSVSNGDMIFIPQGVAHNVINSNKKRPLKLISFYSETDIPEGSAYKRKADEPKE